MSSALLSELLVGRSMGLFSKKQTGNQYETVASRFLFSKGLSLLERNFCTKFGEIDLIMQDGDAIVFVEVKYRKQTHYGHAAEFVDKKKSSRLIKTAYIWLNKRGLSPHTTHFRFDVVAIHQQGSDISWIKNAITQD